MILIFALDLLYFAVEMLNSRGCTESLNVPDYATVLYATESQAKSTLPENELVFATRLLRAGIRNANLTFVNYYHSA